MRYSKTSIFRARIARIPNRSNTLAGSMFCFFAILNSNYCCGGYFYKPELPEVRIKFVLQSILTCKNGPYDFELSKFNLLSKLENDVMGLKIACGVKG